MILNQGFPNALDHFYISRYIAVCIILGLSQKYQLFPYLMIQICKLSKKSPTNGPTFHGPRQLLSIFHSSIYQLTDRGLLGFGPIQVSNEKNPGWLGYIRDYTTQLYRDCNKP